MNNAEARRGWVKGLVLVAAVLAAYGPAWHAGYIWDDDVYLTGNKLLTLPDGLRRIWFSLQSPSQYFPLTYTTFYLERFVWASNPAGYHIVNLLLHGANAVLLWRLLLRLQVPGAWLGAALFALHPVQVESAAWITERKNVLMGFFFLLTLLAWVRFVDEKTQKPWRYYLLALVSYALSLSAKTTACTLPAALLLILWLEKKPIDMKGLRQMGVFLLLGIGMGMVTVWWERYHQGTEGKIFHLGPLERVLLACRALWFYLGKLLCPVNLTFSYPHWTISARDPLAYGWVVLTGLAAAAIWRLRRWTGRSVEVAMLYYAATLSPLLGFIMLYTFVYSYVADHYQYMACIGPLALAAAGMELGMRKCGSAVLRSIVYGALLITLGTLTWFQSATYASAETLWEATLHRNPRSWLAHNDLGTILLNAGDLDGAMFHFQKALAIDPTLAGAYYNIGVINAERGNLDTAIEYYRKGLAIEPKIADARVNLGAALMQQGKLDEAIAEIQKGLDLHTRSPGAHNTLGVIYAKKHEWDKAIEEFVKALQMDPDNEEAKRNLSLTVAQKEQAKKP
jgi:protein O-mannosyl-transferase